MTPTKPEDAHQDVDLAELWLPVVGFEGLYDASDLGRVRSVARGEIMATWPDRDGYPSVTICKNGRKSNAKVHRLVALAFHAEKRNALHREVAHLDNDRANAAARNLQWVSHVENHSHRRAHGTAPIGEKHPRAKLTEKQAQEIRDWSGPYSAAAAKFGVSWDTISDIRRGKRWSHLQSGVKENSCGRTD